MIIKYRFRKHQYPAIERVFCCVYIIRKKKQVNSGNSRKHNKVINIIGGIEMAKGERCPSCKEETFHDAGSVRRCSRCNSVGWGWYHPTNDVGQGRG